MCSLYRKIMLKLINPLIDDMAVNMLTSKYTETPFALLSVFQKLSPRVVMETGMRAESGKSLARPLGSPQVLSPWEKILLNPKQIFELPTQSQKEVQTQTIIGPRCKKPLCLSMPIMITAMSLGASLNVPIKKALALGSGKAGTSTNTGESNVTPEERDNAKFLVGQINRAMRLTDERRLQLVDAIEIQQGQGAWGGSSEIQDKVEDDYLESIWNKPKGSYSVVSPRYPGVSSPDDFVAFVNSIKANYDVPVGIKIAGSDYIEYELEVIAKTNVDFITIDGAEGGTSGAPPTLEDDVGLPTLYSLARAVNWLEENNLKDKFQIIVAGGMKTPGEFIKALAMGADAVYIGSIALMATMHTQITKSLPSYPPTQLAIYTGKLADQFDIEQGAHALTNFLNSCKEEMKAVVQVIGKKETSKLSKEDLVSVDKELAGIIGIRYAGSKRV